VLKLRLFILFSFWIFSILNANPLQDAINNAPIGSIIKLPKGVYKGNIHIDKPLSIIGKDKGVFIDGEESGTVITIKSSFVTLKNLNIIGSGDRHEHLDAGIKITNGKQCEISNCSIKDCLFGIDMQMIDNSIISDNNITSKKAELGLRGDGLRLWYSNDNIIKGNSLIKSRDMVVWYSHGNEIINNYGKDNRYSLHFMYAGKNLIKNNYYELNSVGIFFMYSQDSTAIGNVIKSSQGATGMGIGLKDVSNFIIKDNAVKSTPKIEVVSNSNSKEIKVKEKKVDKNQSKSYYYDYNNVKSEYDPNAQPANKDASVRVRPRTKLDANINIRSPYERVQISLLSGQLSKNFRIKCSACHDDYANGVIGPSLISRDEEFIYQRINDFKNGKKSNPLMKDLVSMMSDEEIKGIAKEIYNFNIKIKEMRERQK